MGTVIDYQLRDIPFRNSQARLTARIDAWYSAVEQRAHAAAAWDALEAARAQRDAAIERAREPLACHDGPCPRLRSSPKCFACPERSTVSAFLERKDW